MGEYKPMLGRQVSADVGGRGGNGGQGGGVGRWVGPRGKGGRELGGEVSISRVSLERGKHKPNRLGAGIILKLEI